MEDTAQVKQRFGILHILFGRINPVDHCFRLSRGWLQGMFNQILNGAITFESEVDVSGDPMYLTPAPRSYLVALKKLGSDCWYPVQGLLERSLSRSSGVRRENRGWWRGDCFPCVIMRSVWNDVRSFLLSARRFKTRTRNYAIVGFIETRDWRDTCFFGGWLFKRFEGVR
jgi:hypothetical protein